MLLGCLALLVLVVIENETNIFLFWYILTENMLGTMQFVATARFPYHNGFKIQEIALRLKRHFLNPSVFALFRSTFTFQRDNACQHDTFFMSNTWEASGLVIISPLAKNTFLKGGMKKSGCKTVLMKRLHLHCAQIIFKQHSNNIRKMFRKCSRFIQRILSGDQTIQEWQGAFWSDKRNHNFGKMFFF